MKTSFKKRLMVILTLMVLAVCVNGVPPAQAAIFTVSNLNDSGAGSLRQAIDDANTAVGADTITFSVSGTITLASSLPNITEATGLTIDGTGQTVTISGNGLYRVLFVDASASLNLHNLTITNGNNISGGGVYNSGTLTITDSTFSGNNAPGGGYGGGIYNTGSLIIMNSTFSDNDSGWAGGGIFSSGTLTITNSTFSGNSTTYGGGIGDDGTLTITNSTFFGNSATLGGGILNNSGTATLLNIIVANSTSGGNCSGTITNGGNNIDDGTTCGWGSTDGSISSTDPLLGALADNGGPTQTFALLTGSPAMDGVTFNAPNSAPSMDQRGVARPQGVGYDIGAFESEPSGPALELAYTTEFILEWWDVGSGGDYDGAYYQPTAPVGFHALGHYGQGHYGAPVGGMFVARELEPGALAQPVDYSMVWGDYGSGADWDGSFWTPVAPPGYVCLGLVAQYGYAKPALDEIRCVREDLTRPGSIGPMIWIDQGTEADTDFGSWFVIPEDGTGLYIGTFTGHTLHTPPTFPLYVLDSASVITDVGSITVVKDALPDNAQDFDFTGSGPSGYDFGGGFSLDDDAIGPLANTVTFSYLTPGSYSLTEDITAGWSLSDLVCVDPDGGSIVDLGARTATIDLDADETVTCTYTNTSNEGYYAIVDVYVTNRGDPDRVPPDGLTPPDSAYTGVTWLQVPEFSPICTVPHEPGDPGTYVEPHDINTGIGGHWVYLWVKYDWVEATATTPVLVDIAVHHWPYWNVTCPVGWEPAHGDSGGMLTTQADDACWRNGLCVRYAPMNETDTFITNLNLSLGGSEALVPALCPANEGYWPMRQDDLDIHMGCGDDQWMFLTYNQARRWPAMPTSLPTPSNSEKASSLDLYAPRVWLADYEPDHPEGEIYFPSSVEWSFEHLYRNWLTVVSPSLPLASWWLFTEEALGSPSAVLPYFHGCDGFSTGSPCDLADTPAYAFWDEVEVDVAGESVVVHDLIYFFFYPYNRGKEVLFTIYGNHVGDWEHVSVRLTPQWDESNGWLLKPAQIYLSAHDFGRNYGWDQITTEVGYEIFLPVVLRQASASPSAGVAQSVPVALDSLSSPLATHPVVYAAWGAHGLWRDPGRHVYKQTPIGDLSDWTGAGTAWDTWLNLIAFDYDTESGLAGSTWPVWMSQDYLNQFNGDSDPASGPIYRWGNFEGGCTITGDCRLENGPTGPVDKGVWDVEILQ